MENTKISCLVDRIDLFDDDIRLGSIDSRSLTIRLISPMAFRRWSDHRGFRFCWWKLFSMKEWAAWYRYDEKWSFEFNWKSNINSRCWCPVGHSAFLRVLLMGFGLVAFYSVYDGPRPCVCDEVLDVV